MPSILLTNLKKKAYKSSKYNNYFFILIIILKNLIQQLKKSKFKIYRDKFFINNIKIK